MAIRLNGIQQNSFYKLAWEGVVHDGEEGAVRNNKETRGRMKSGFIIVFRVILKTIFALWQFASDVW